MWWANGECGVIYKGLIVIIKCNKPRRRIIPSHKRRMRKNVNKIKKSINFIFFLFHQRTKANANANNHKLLRGTVCRTDSFAFVSPSFLPCLMIRRSVIREWHHNWLGLAIYDLLCSWRTLAYFDLAICSVNINFRDTGRSASFSL